MISVELAQRLRAAGLVWTPRSGDRFVIADRGMDEEVFVVSELTIDVFDAPTGRLLRFNGTTEWALDSVEQDAAVWLPYEGQLREALGEAFLRLEPIGDGFAVVIALDGAQDGALDGALDGAQDGAQERHVDTDAERAYARAVLAVLEASGPSAG